MPHTRGQYIAELGFAVRNGANGVETTVIDSNGNLRPSSIFGDTYFVDYANGLDTNDGLSKDKAFKTLSAAYAAATSDNNDVIFVNGVATVVETAMITWAKNRIHVIGVGAGQRYGQAAKISLAATSGATNIATLKVTGVRNSFTNLKFMNASTVTEGIYCVAEGGEYTVYTNCEFYKSTHLNSDTAAELLLNGDSAQFFNCTFGSIADLVVGDKIRAAVITTGGVVGAGVSRDVLFENCKFWKNAGGTATAMIKIAADNDLERVMEIKDCIFVANKLGAVPAVAIASATLTKSQVLLTGNTIACNCTKIGTATGIINGTPARVATATIGIQAT
jgi:hypothetical protein